MQTKIIAGFPGVGKSFYHNLHKNTTLDSDSSKFSWIIEDGMKIRNPLFPYNYIQHIKENIGKCETIFVSTHIDVRNALRDNCLFFYLLYPDIKRKEEFIRRFKDRGSDQSFIDLVSDNWNIWVNECMDFNYDGCIHIRMDEDIVDTMNDLVR